MNAEVFLKIKILFRLKSDEKCKIVFSNSNELDPSFGWRVEQQAKDDVILARTTHF